MEKQQAKKEHRSVLRKMFLYSLIILFFIGVIFVYYNRLYSEIRENYINRGRINAIEAADQIDRRLSASADILLLAGYTIDGMLRNGSSNREILDYLTGETVAVKDSLIADTTGVYGYINGEYMDGSGWIPEEGYDPTARPWYLSAMEGDGDVVVVDPYLDMDTGTLMISLVRTLSDGESVVGIDISMDELQSVVEAHTAQGSSYSEFIANAEGTVIAHSHPEWVGMNIYEGEDPLSKAFAEKIHPTVSSYFTMTFENRQIMAYIMPLENGWVCVSTLDATEVLSAQNRTLFLTILVALLMVAVFLFFIYQSEKKSLAIRESEVLAERALASNEAKTSFLSNMSHEIRTPINAILGMNEMVLRESEDEEILMYSENIRSAGNTLLGLINDILDFSKIEAGKIEIIPVDYDISSVINDLVNMIATRADDKGLTLNLDFDPMLPRRMNGDEVRIKQVITNILTNAVKYTKKGSVTFRIGCERIAEDPESVMLKVSVKDTGIGIRPEDIDKLFSKFERIEEKRNRNIEGTGLGMSITKSLLERMGSALEVESVYGEGSEFRFALKQRIVNSQPMGDYSEAYQKGNGKRKRYQERFTAPEARILVVDDNPMNLTVFNGLIRQTKIIVDTATEGEEAAAITRNIKYDMIFLDHMMPGMDGIETLHEIQKARNVNFETPAICLTANAIAGAREEYLKEGFHDYLSKPIDAAKLDGLLLRYLPPEKVLITQEEEQEDCGQEEQLLPERLKELDRSAVDIQAGIKNSGSAKLYLSVLDTFLDAAEEKKKELEALYDARDFENYRIRIHALKSSVKIIGAAALGEEAQKLEDAGKAGDTAYILAHHGEFMTEYDRIRGLVADAVASEDAAAGAAKDQPEADAEMMREVYEEIRSAAEAMDYERLEAMIGDMKEYRITESESERYESIKQAVQELDYDRILSLLG